MRTCELSPTVSTCFATGVAIAALALAPAPAQGQDRPLRLTWVDRTGQVIETVGPPGAFRGPDLSQDGMRLAVHRHDGNGGDIWLSDPRGGLVQLTTDTSGTHENASPVFSPDGTRIVFASLRNGKWGLYVKRVDGRGEEERLIESGSRKMPMSWSPDGRFIVYWVNGGSQWVIPLEGTREPRRLHDMQNSHAQISPDGRWVAYNSLGQIYVKPFPTGEGSWQVSTNGGVFARWCGDSRELYFLSRGFLGQMMAADINVTGSSIQPGTPRPLFESGYVNLNHPGGNYHTYSVSPDGQRFLIPRPEPGTLTMFDRDGQVVKTLGRDLGASPVFSPDGSRVALVKDLRDVWVVEVETGHEVRITSNQPQDLVGGLVWSPDGRQLAYLLQQIDRELLYLTASDGKGPQELRYRLPGFGISLTDWSPDGRFLLYYSSQLGGNRLIALPVSGEPTPVEVMRSDVPILGARLSPDGRLLAYQTTESPDSDTPQLWVRSFDFAAGGAGAAAWQVPAEASRTMTLGLWWKGDGRELYYLGPKRGVMAVEVRVAPTVEFGRPRLLFSAPDSIPENPEVLGSVSRDGRRVVLSVTPPGASPLPDQLFQIALLDRQGRTLQRIGAPGRYGQPALSPDGTRVAVRRFDSVAAGGRSDIWSIEIATGKSTPITSDAPADSNPLWSPDGRHILYVSFRSGGYAGIYRKNWDGSGKEELLYRYTPGAPVLLRDISPDGKYLTFNSGGVVLVVPLGGTDPSTRQAVELSREEFAVAGGLFSPDGRFIAYSSNESDNFELYVQPFDAASGSVATGGKRQVSKEGAGPMAFWRGDGREMYFIDTEPDLVVMAVDISTAPVVQPGTPRVLFHVPGHVQGDLGATKYISRDGQRFVFILPVAAVATPAR